jgi:hypothetical protein
MAYDDIGWSIATLDTSIPRYLQDISSLLSGHQIIKRPTINNLRITSPGRANAADLQKKNVHINAYQQRGSFVPLLVGQRQVDYDKESQLSLTPLHIVM